MTTTTTTHSSSPARQTLKVAVLHEGVQLLDILAIDLLGNISTSYLRACIAAFPSAYTPTSAAHLLSQAVDIEFRYVASTLAPTEATPGIKILPTHTYEGCPVEDLDVLLVGGPFPDMRPPESLEMMRRFMGEKGNKEGRLLLTTCVGSLWVADAGCLEGREVTTNRGALGLAREKHGATEWVDRRWVVDGGREGQVEVWSSGGAMAGLDMVASWMGQRFGKEVVAVGLWGLDFDVKGRGEEYDEEMPGALGS